MWDGKFEIGVEFVLLTGFGECRLCFRDGDGLVVRRL